MLVSEAGEFGLIELLSRELGVTFPPEAGARPRPGLLVDLGDDALVAQRADEALVLTTDTMVAGVHFLPGRTAWEDVGWKALASNVSDIAAMGGTPRLAIVTLLLPQDTEVDNLLALYRGLKECSEACEVLIAGGDIVRAPVFAVTIAVSGAAGLGPDGSPSALRRNAARPGDVVAVTGTLGDSAGGLQVLLAGVTTPSDDQRSLIEAHNRPRPRPDAGRAALIAGVTCAIDISDGLVQDLGHVARASGVTVEVEAANVPLSDALKRLYPDSALQLAFAGGEDYQLAMIGPREAIDRLRQAVADVTLIGHVTDAAGPRAVVVDEKGGEILIARRGFDHFAGGSA